MSLHGRDYSQNMNPTAIPWAICALVIGAELALFWWLA